MTTARLAIDIGGTFTDFVLALGDGTVHRLKLHSTPNDYAEAIGIGLDRLLAMAELPPSALHEVLHATTIASNAIIEGKAARTGLITTRGFRDILEIRTLRMPRLYDLHWQKPPPLVERALRCEVDERLDASGAVRTPLDEAAVIAALDTLLAEGVQAIAVCLLHAYANDAHERRVGELVRQRAPGVALSLSTDVLPEVREYERTSTTVMNAMLQPVVTAYLDRLRAVLAGRAVTAPLLLMQSAGGLMPASLAARRPVSVVESGPAAGVISAIALGAEAGLADLICFDMGGTTAKAALVAGGEASRAAEFQVGGAIMTGSRLLTGSGYTLRMPAIDLAEVGAGGGSVVWLDPAGAPQVGPRSAGALPGPVCYGQGGSEPTITDCALVLGWLNPAGLAGGLIPLDTEAAAAALEARIARPLGLPVAEAAYGAVEVATATMTRAIRAVSSERGADPRAHVLVAFGGNGGTFGPLAARQLGMRRVLIPPSPGLFSATGLLHAVIEHEVVRTHKVLLAAADADAINARLAALEATAREALAEGGVGSADLAVQRQARLRYHGQSFELAVPLPSTALDRPALADLAVAFGVAHERTYGHRAGAEEPVELVTLVVRARARAAAVDTGSSMPVRSHPRPATRPAYFGPAAGWREVQLVDRHDLHGDAVRGPLIIEEYDATIVVPPAAVARLDASGNIVLEFPNP